MTRPKSSGPPPYQGDVHALIILGHDDPAELVRHTDAVRKSLAPVAADTWVERGDRLEFDFARGRLTIEHFGFEDGVSNPVLLLPDAERERAQRGFDKWDAA